MTKVKFKKLYSDTLTPVKSHNTDAGFDVFARETITIKPHEHHQFKLGFALEFQSDYVCFVQIKSGRALRECLTTIGNVIDSGYRGECSVIMLNAGKEPVTILREQKIAQLVFIKIARVDKLTLYEELSSSDRGQSGYGSTGLT